MKIQRLISAVAAAVMALSCCAVSVMAETTTIYDDSSKSIELTTDNKSSAEATVMTDGNYDNFTVTFTLEDYANSGSYAQLMAYDTNNNPLMYINMYHTDSNGNGYVCGDTSYAWSDNKNYRLDGTAGRFSIDIKIIVNDGKSTMYVNDVERACLDTAAINLGKFIATGTASDKWQQFTISNLVITTETQNAQGQNADKISAELIDGEAQDAAGFTYSFTGGANSVKWYVSNGSKTKEINGKIPTINAAGETIIGLLITDIPDDIAQTISATVSIN